MYGDIDKDTKLSKNSINHSKRVEGSGGISF